MNLNNRKKDKPSTLPRTSVSNNTAERHACYVPESANTASLRQEWFDVVPVPANTAQLRQEWFDVVLLKVKSFTARSLPVENLLPQNVGSIISYLQ